MRRADAQSAAAPLKYLILMGESYHSLIGLVSPQNLWVLRGPRIKLKWAGEARPFQGFALRTKRLYAALAANMDSLLCVRGKKHPPTRSSGEWGAHSLIGLSIGLYLLLSRIAVRIQIVWGNRGNSGNFQSLKQLCTQISALVSTKTFSCGSS